MNYILTFLLLFSFLSCDKKASMKSIDFSEVDLPEEAKNKEIKTELTFYELPMIKLHGVDSQVIILNSKEEVHKDVSIEISRNRHIRNKIQRIITNPYKEKLDLEDLFIFSYKIKESELLKVIKGIHLKELSEYSVSVSSNFLLESSGKGLLETLDYHSGLEGSYNNHKINLLENSSEQTSGFEFGLKAKEYYKFKTPQYELYDFFKKSLSGNNVMYQLVDFSLGSKKLSEWKERVLEEGSILIISEESKEDFVFVKDGETISSALKREGKAFDLNFEFRSINFSRFDEKISANQVLALYFLGDITEKPKRKVSHINEIKKTKFTKMKGRNIHIISQLRGDKYTIKHWYEPKVVLMFINGNFYGDRRTCNVSRRKVEVAPIKLDIEKEKFSYRFSFEGKVISLESLVKSKSATVKIIGNKQLITVHNLPSQSDQVEVEFDLISTMVETTVSQDRGQCKLMNRSRSEDDEGVIRVKSNIEKFESFKESSIKDSIGVDKFMDIIVLN